MIGLNLGCGRAQFPTTLDNPFTKHIAWALPMFCPEALDHGAIWDNVDRQPSPGVNRVVNLFRYPFVDSQRKGFESDHYDVIWCGHIAEHIPHAIKLNHAGDSILCAMNDRDEDGWFAFFYECWRVLKPGGRLNILSPYGISVGGMTDPTHTRYLTPGSFSYFQPNPNAPFDYGIPFAFEMDFEQNTPAGSMRLVDDAATLSREMAALGAQGHTEQSPAIKDMANNMEIFTRHHVGYIEEFCYRFVKTYPPTR